MSDVHYCAWSSQPDIQIFCDGSWAQPAWTHPETETPEVYRTDDDRLYTFEKDPVTCPACRSKMALTNKEER